MATEAVHEVPGAAGDELHGARGQEPGLDDEADTHLREGAVGVAGFTIIGRPARIVGPSFSRKPHTGKLNALMASTRPGREVWIVWPSMYLATCSGVPST